MSEEDFETFVRAHWRQLRATVGRYARRFDAEADDALQEALLRAHAKWGSFESERHAVNWICRVAHDLMCDERRSWYARRVATSAELPECGLGMSPDPAETLVRRESGQRVTRALADLPAAQRLVLWQHAVDGRSYADIARETARPLATVRSIALRARTAARQRLAPEHGALGAGLWVRLRTWWARIQARGVPTDGVAAVLALALGLGGLGTGAGGAAVPVPGVVGMGDHVPAPVRAAAAGVRRTPAGRPAAARPPVASAPTRSPAPAPVPFDNAAFTGERWGRCTFGDTGRPGLVSSVVPEGSYHCEVWAKSASCWILPAGGGCEVTIHGVATGPTTWNGVPDEVQQCAINGGGRGEIAVRIEGGDTYVMPTLLGISNAQLYVNAGLVVHGRRLAVSITTPFACAEEVGRAPLAGRLTVYDEG